MPYVPLSMPSGTGRIGCAGVRFSIHRGWYSRDVVLLTLCRRVCEFSKLVDNLVGYLATVYSVVYFILFAGV